MHTGRVSQDFTWEEVEHSETAERLGIDNTVPTELIEIIRKTAVWAQAVRAILARPMLINSWYRCPALQLLPQFINPTSQHPLGEAIDFICPSFGTPVAVCRKILQYSTTIPFDQLILEYSWVHLSFSTSNPTRKARGQVLSLLSNKKYASGLTDVEGNPI